MLKKIFFCFVIISIFLFSFVNNSFAQNCSDTDTDCLQKAISSCQDASCVNDIKNKLDSKLSNIRQEKNTLSSQIQYMNTQINIALTKIKETELNILRITDEIENLDKKIDGLNNSLDYLSKILLKKISEGYKKKQVSLIEIILDSRNATTLTNQLKYIKISQENDRRIAFQLQQAKANSEEQKKLREEKKIELDKLKVQLDSQKISLNNQKASKQKLLEDTNNSETTYQNLLAAAYRQLSAFKSFVQGAGGGAIGANEFGTGEGGWYFSQRDSRWANNRIGNSQEIILNVGCLLTSVSMVLKQRGVDTNPAIIAANNNYFYLNTAYMEYRNRISLPNGLKGYNISISEINNELKNGNPVIIGLYAGSYGQHFIVLKKLDGDNNYIINDPYYGPDKKFSEYYSKNQIFSAEIIK